MSVRVASIVGNLIRRGTQRAAYRYASIYGNYYTKSSLLALHGGGGFEEEVRSSNIDLFIGGEGKNKVKAIEKMSKWNPDLIHIHRRGDGGHGILRAAEKISEEVGEKIPIVETNVFARVDRSEKRNLIDLHFLLSRWCLWKWKSWGRDLNPAPVGTVLPYPIDKSKFYPSSKRRVSEFRKSKGISESEFLYTRVGGSGPSKWSKISINSFAKLTEDKKYIRLMLVNPPRKITTKIETLTERVRDKIYIIEKIESDDVLRDIYSSSEVFIHASRIGESFGMVLGESMACGTPVITLSTPLKDNSQIEVVGHNKGGLIAVSQTGFKKAMSTLYEDQDMLEKLGRSAIDRVKSNYSEEQVATELIKKVDKILNNSGCVNSEEVVGSSEDLDSLNSWIEEQLKDSIGKVGIVKKFVMRLVHMPRVYKTYRFLKCTLN